MNTTIKVPSRFELAGLYCNILKIAKEKNWQLSNMYNERTRALQASPEQIQEIKALINEFPEESRYMLRYLNDQTRELVTGDYRRAGQILTVLLPRIRDLENAERSTYKHLPPLEGKRVFLASELIYEHLVHESPAYLRRLISGALFMDHYQLARTEILGEQVANLESQQAEWLLSGGSPESEIIRAICRTGPDGSPVELPGGRSTGIPHLDFLAEQLPGLIKLSGFRRSDNSWFARFINGMPTLLMPYYGSSDIQLDARFQDALMDLSDSTMVLHRNLYANAEEASRIWGMLHVGIPIFKDLYSLGNRQNALLRHDVEGVIMRFSHILPELLKLEYGREEMSQYLRLTNIVTSYARHRGVFVDTFEQA